MSADAAAIAEALEENDDLPFGDVRSARADQLAELAAQSGDRALLVRALLDVITAYTYNSEADKVFVPFARLMRLWDESPGDFDRWAVHRFHWQFKWVSSGMLDYPQIPLVTIRSWLADMEVRYRRAGYGLNAVRKVEFDIAQHLGDRPAAEAALAAWGATERDEMSDCRACELNDHGDFLASTGRDAEALDVWRPVLDGQACCSEEPHWVLAQSLLPLLRVGKADEARANHLRGYRLVRGNTNLLAPVGRHLEFCALTGNEARALEILAEHRSYLARDIDIETRLDFEAAVAVLLRRLCALGLGGQAVPGADADTTAAELLTRIERSVFGVAQSFDARNGNTHVSSVLRERLDQQPVVSALPLGLRAGPLAESAPAAEPAAADPAALLAEARELSALGHPRASAAWVRAAGAAELDPLAAAEHECSAALDQLTDDPGTARGRFAALAQRFAELSAAERAVRCRAHAGVALAYTGRAEEAVAETTAAYAQIRELPASGSDVIAVGRAHATVLMSMSREDELLAVLADLTSVAERHGAERELGPIHGMRGMVEVSRGEVVAAEASLRASVEAFEHSGRPWAAAQPLYLLGGMYLHHGRVDEAADAARSAYAHGSGLVRPGLTARVRMLMADIASAQDDPEAMAAAAADAAHWFATAAETAEAAHARLLLGKAYRWLGRHAEAATVLDDVIPELGDDDERLAQARQILGSCLVELGEPRGAAEQFLLAADIAQNWEDQTAHALVASDAGHALVDAGLQSEAAAAFDRAIGLWRELGQTGALTRVLRARAHVAYYGLDDLDAAIALFGDAEAVLMDAAKPGQEPPDDCDLAFELAETPMQLARILTRAAERDDDPVRHARTALQQAERAAARFAARGPDALGELLNAHGLAAQIEARHLGRNSDAIARVRRVLAETPEHEQTGPLRAFLTYLEA